MTKILIIVGGFLFGEYLDEMFGTEPFLKLTGVIVGFALGSRQTEQQVLGANEFVFE